MTNKNTTTWLGDIFEWLGNVFEVFNPSAFRFLAAVLPYLTPIPVAVLTSNSASDFLHFTPSVAFTFVFALEGIGLWFTSMFVDSVVEWVRSRNIKSSAPVVLFALTISAYIYILVTLNVTLEAAIGNVSPFLSRVVTLLCFLPLITGVGNGYYKLQIDYKNKILSERDHSESREDQLRREADERAARIRKENNELKLKKLALNKGFVPKDLAQEYAYDEKQVKPKRTQQKEEQVSTDWRKYSLTLSSEEIYELAHLEDKEDKEAWADRVGVTLKTIDNWKLNAQYKLISNFIKSTGSFPDENELISMNIPAISVAKFIILNGNKLVQQGFISQQIVENARQRVNK